MAFTDEMNAAFDHAIRPAVIEDFEGGIGIGRSVIWMCREDDLTNVHFDTRQYNHIVWTGHDDLRAKLRDRLRATVALPARLG